MKTKTIPERLFAYLPPAVVGFSVLLWCANLLLGNLNQDEGWYLLAALRTAKGALPYRDYFFTQGPLMPLVYGALSPLWGPLGVLGGRLVSGAFGFGAVLASAALAARLSDRDFRRHAALGVWLFAACAPAHGYFSVLSKTYSLAGFFLSLGFLCMSRGGRGVFGAGFLLGLSAATRVSLAPALLCSLAVLWLWRYREGWRRAWMHLACGGGLALLLTYGPALLWARGNFVYAQLYHATREGGGLLGGLVLRAGFVSRSLQAYPLLWVVTAVLLLSFVFRSPGARSYFIDDRPRGEARAARRGPVFHAASWSVAAVTLLHALSPFPYDDYQTPVMPLLAAVAAASFFARVSGPAPGVRGGGRAPAAALFCAASLLALGSPLLMEWQVIRKDRFWFETKARPDILVLRDVGRWLRENSAEGDPLLTQDAYLAVEARREVPTGLEMGPFSLFPYLSDAEARRLKLHNLETMRSLILSGAAPLAATSGYSFAIACPGTEPLDRADRAWLFAALEEKYEPALELDDFGQAHTALTIWRLRR